MRAALALLLLTGCGQATPTDPAAPAARAAAAPRVIELPAQLREASGLAMASPTSVFTHNDESAAIAEIDLASGRMLRRFTLGQPPLVDDFEGIAATADRVFLISSTGRLLSAAPGADGTSVAYDSVDTGAGEACEIEGLSLSPQPGQLLILCKNVRGRGNGGRLLIFSWDIAARRLEQRPWLDTDLTADLAGDRHGFAPSSLDWDARTRRAVVVSARDRLLLVIDENGRIVERRTLDEGRHPQAEGVAVTPAGQLVVADEGGRGRPGTLTVYPGIPEP